MITAAFPNSAKVDLLQRGAADEYRIALYTSAATLSKATTVYTSAGAVVGTGYTAGGKVLTGAAVSLDGDTAILDFSDPSWPDATITARGALIYNATQSNKAVAVLDFGADVASTAAAFTVQLPAPTAAAGLVRVL